MSADLLAPLLVKQGSAGTHTHIYLVRRSRSAAVEQQFNLHSRFRIMEKRVITLLHEHIFLLLSANRLLSQPPHVNDEQGDAR